jgi:hypothetical protein
MLLPALAPMYFNPLKNLRGWEFAEKLMDEEQSSS